MEMLVGGLDSDFGTGKAGACGSLPRRARAWTMLASSRSLGLGEWSW